MYFRSKKLLTIILVLAATLCAGALLLPLSATYAQDDGQNSTIYLPVMPTNELSNVEKAQALVKAFETGDTSALDYVSDDTYIQHNLGVPSGKEVLNGFITGSSTGITVTTARTMADGDFVILHNVYGGVWNDGTPQVAFDVFRFDDGLIVEHWDNLGDLTDDGDGTTQTDGALTPATELDKTEANRTALKDMAQVLFVDGDWSKVRDYFNLDAYIQHSVGAGADGSFLATLEGQTLPFYTSVEAVFAEGNFGLVISQGPDITQQDPDGTYAYYDLFRMADGLIVEHWDVIQVIPPADEQQNENGKFNFPQMPSNNAEKAQALVKAFETGDTSALDYVSDETYIQHNLGVPNGKEVLNSFVTGSATGITVTTARTMADGDFVILHNVYGGVWNDGTPQVAFDVFRFDDGLIVEHWDNLGDLTDDGDGTTQTDGVLTPATELDKTEANRAALKDMAQVLFVDGDWSKVRDYFNLDAYIQHSVGAGTDGSFLATLEGQTLPFYTSVEAVFAEGNFGLVISQGPDITQQDPDGTYAYYDLFRMEDGLIVEHWDVIQVIPPADEQQNENGKFNFPAALSVETMTRDSGLMVTKQELGGVTVHSVTAPEAVFANSTHIIETANNLVLVDTQFLLPNAQDFRAYADSLGKPIERVLITHEHPDHFLGSEAFNDVPIYALADVSAAIAASGDAEIAEKQADFGPDNIASTFVTPTVMMTGTVEIDGVTFQFDEVLDAEAEYQLVTRLPNYGVIVVGDIVYSGVHLIMAGAPDTWTTALEGLKADSADYPIVLAGHGVPGDPDLYDANIAWLAKAQELIGTATTGEEFKNGMIAAFPALGMSAAIDFVLPILFPIQKIETITRESGLVVTKQTLNGAVVHSVTAPEAVFANSTHIIETPNSLVLVDTQFLLPNALDFRAYADSLGKPIERVLITHEHPDHFLGSEALILLGALRPASSVIWASHMGV